MGLYARTDWLRNFAVILIGGDTVQYMAVDNENIEVLKGLKRWPSKYHWFRHKARPVNSPGWSAFYRESVNADEDEDVFVPVDKCSPAAVLGEDTAEELIPGIGIHDIRVGLRYVFCEREPVHSYDYAYKAGDRLVLIGSNIRREYEFRLLTELVVRRSEILRCGLPIERDYFVIDCREEKERQILGPEVWKPDKEEREACQNLTVIWNRKYRQQDMSEIWEGCGEDGCMSWDALMEREDGYTPKFIEIGGKIGYMYMPGIYYFGQSVDQFPKEELIRKDKRWLRSYAAVTRSGMVQYAAIDDENIEVLRRIMRLSDGVWRCQKARSADYSPALMGFFDDFEVTSYWDPFDDFDCEDDGAVKTDMRSLSAVLEETTAEELIPGIGIRNISVCLRYVFGGWESRNYDYAYKTEDCLVLIDGNHRREYDLRLVTDLIVTRIEVLNCGLLIEREYFLIDCKEEKEKQILGSEVYELLRSYRKERKDGNRRIRCTIR